ncbi:MAG: hypothetical protein DMG20_06980 [Acidobacteria bacterium]|nr:MAG: hypothetical protein DMG20_06980 [Acidobacteriota bacterium]
MRLPEAFRGQDFTHHDVIALIQRFCESSTTKDKPIVIVGLRTAGAYFAPLMALYLKRSNWSRVAWFSIRPKSGISVWEQWQLRSAARHDSRVLVVDDYPATGKTLTRFAATFGRSNLLEFVDTLARNTPQIRAGPLLRFHWPANPQP